MNSFSDTHLTFNWARPPLPSLSSIDFFKIQAVGKSECGSAGVVFLETNEGSFCVKACTDSIATEYFSHLLFQQNKIEVPNILLVPCTSYKWNVIKNTIELATVKDEALRRSIKSKLQSPMFLLMEYVPSLTITYMGPKKAEQIFSGIDEISVERLINLGRIFAMDTIINNSDRYPIVWDNNGNPENLLLKVRTLENTTVKELRDPFNLSLQFLSFVAIDSRVNLLDKNCKYSLPNLIKYEEHMHEFVKDLLRYIEEIRVLYEDNIDLMKIIEGKKMNLFIKFKGLRKFILKYSFYEITQQNEFLIALGILICYENLSRTKLARIENLLITLKKTSEKWNNLEFIWVENLNKINLEFIQIIFKVLEEEIKGFDKTLNWIHTITGRKFFISEKEEFDNQTLIDKSLLVDELKEEVDFFKKIAGETAEEVEKLKKKRGLELQKEDLKIWNKIKEKKAEKKKKNF